VPLSAIAADADTFGELQHCLDRAAAAARRARDAHGAARSPRVLELAGVADVLDQLSALVALGVAHDAAGPGAPLPRAPGQREHPCGVVVRDRG
jgi:hypothetical protein